MEQLIKLLSSTYEDKSKINYIAEILKDCQNNEGNNKIYDFEFVLAVANNVVANKMDLDAVIVAILYCLGRGGLYDLKNITNVDYVSNIKSLLNISKLEMSTKQETQVSLNKMFLSLAKDIRVMIIKLCIEAEKINIMGRLSAEQKDNLMKSHRDVYAPIAAMLGISRIKDIMEDAAFKYFNPKFYAELEQTINTYVAQGVDKINRAVNRLKDELSPLIANVKVYGRQKKLVSIAKKLQKKKMNVDTIASVYKTNGLEEAVEAKSFKDVNTNFHQVVNTSSVSSLTSSLQCTLFPSFFAV